MYSISSGCSDGNQHRYGTWLIDEPQVFNHQLTKTLPDQELERKKVPGWLGHGGETHQMSLATTGPHSVSLYNIIIIL